MPAERNLFFRTSWVRRRKSTFQSAGCRLSGSPRSFKRDDSLKITPGLLITLFLCWGLVPAREAVAAFASSVSLSVGEEYSDNIFFSKKNESDFITHVIPTFRFSYVPSSETVPILNVSLSPGAELFAGHPELNNFGDNLGFSAGYTYRYSPRLTFHVADTLRRGGADRTVGLEGLGPPQQLPQTPTMFPSPGGFVPLPLIQDIGVLVSKGRTVTNYFSLNGAFLAAQNVTISGGYGAAYRRLSSQGGGDDINHILSILGGYRWREQHNLHAGYTMYIVSSPSGRGGVNRGQTVVHSFDIGDDYFSDFKIQLDPTLTLSAKSGIGVNAGGGGPRIVNNLDLTLIKIWQTATFTAALRRGLTGSFGIGGVSDTTSVSSGFTIRLTERLTGSAGAEYSLFDTSDVNFRTFRTAGGMEYWITSWLSSKLVYSYRWLNSGGGSGSANLVTNGRGRVQGNNIFLALSMHFDVWPNVGLSRAPARPFYAPLGAPIYAPPPTQQPPSGEAVTPQPPATQPGTPQPPRSP